MKSKKILFIHHSPSVNTVKLSSHILNKLCNFSNNVDFKMLSPLETNSSSFDFDINS